VSKTLTDDQVRKRLAALDRFKQEAINIGVWDLVVNVSKGVNGRIEDWPAAIREPIEAAIARDCIPKPGWHVAVVASGCFQDVAWEPCYIRVIVQEFPPIVRH